MAGYFTDSSAVVKRYVQEVGSSWVGSLFSAIPGHEIAIVEITAVEVVSAITRRSRGGTISLADANASCNLFLADLNTDYQIIAVTDILLRQAIHLARTHGLRGYDAVQLAAANEVNHLRVITGLPPIVSVSADSELNAAAQSEGLIVDDPNAHP